MLETKFDKDIAKGHLASISKKGWLWLSKLCDIEYMHDATHAVVSYDLENDSVKVFPFKAPSNWWCQPDEFKLWAIEDNGILIRAPWLRDLAASRDLYGQYIPNYDPDERMIRLKLKERIRKYGR